MTFRTTDVKLPTLGGGIAVFITLLLAWTQFNPSIAEGRLMAGNSTSSDRPSVSIDHQKAVEIARAVITGLGPERDLVIEHEKTIEKPFGWIFFYTTRQYLLTGDKSSLMPGNGPLVVDRETGQHEFLSTSMPPSAAIDVYEKRWLEQRRDP